VAILAVAVAVGVLGLAYRVSGVVAAVSALAVLVVPTALLVVILGTRSMAWSINLVVGAAATGLAVVAIAGLALNQLPGGLNQVSWLGFALVMLTAAGIAQWVAPSRSPSLPRLSWPSVRDVAPLVGAGGVVVLAIFVARVGLQPVPEHFSSLWAIPDGSRTLRIGVANEEGGDTAYRVEVVIDGAVNRTVPVSVASGGQWTTDVAVPSGVSNVEVRLYLASDPTVVYRRATVPVPGAPTAAP
jgi:hypothetical protein